MKITSNDSSFFVSVLLYNMFILVVAMLGALSAHGDLNGGFSSSKNEPLIVARAKCIWYSVANTSLYCEWWSKVA